MKDKPNGKIAGWQTLAAKYIFESPWHKIRQDQVRLKGEDLTYTWLEHPGSVFVVPVTSDQKIVLIRVYRYTVDEWCWELPAGGIGDKGNVPLEQAAREELLEETGFTGGNFEMLGIYFAANGVADLRYTIFLARGVERTHSTKHEHTETIDEVRLFSLQEVRGMILRGEIPDSETSLSLLLALAKLG